MKDMKEAELKVTLAIARKTFGWHKREDQLSLSQLMELTGLSRQGVLNGIEAGLERGTICRREMGQRYLYSIPVNEVDQSTSQRSRPVLVNEVDQLPPKLVNEVDTQKKGIKERKKEKPSASSSDENSSIPSADGSECLQQSLLNQETNTPSPKVPPAPLPNETQAMFGAICEVTGTEAGKLMTQRKRGQVSKVGKLLREAGYTSRDVEAWYKDVWLKDWRGEKGGRPTITQVQEEIHKVRELPSRDDAGWGFNTGAQW